MNKAKKNSVFAPLLFLSFAGLGYGMWLFLCRIEAVSMLTYQIRVNPRCLSPFWFLLTGLFALPFLAPGLRGIRKKLTMAVLPFLLFFFLPRDNFFFFPGFILALGWGVFRLIRCFGCRTLKTYPILTDDRKGGILAVLALAFAASLALWGYHMQAQAYRGLYLCYSDWGIYYESYLRLASGEAAWREFLSTGAHWNPLPNAVMALFVKLFPGSNAFFLFHSLLIYSAVPLTWILCRQTGLRSFHCFCFAMAAAFSPVYGNLSLCLFYGFHPISFVIPVLLLFFIFRAAKNRTGMILCMAATMMMKETMMIFWAGYGFWLLTGKGRTRIAGAFLSIFSLLGFFLLSSKVLPALVDTSVYPLTFLYSELGDSPSAVILSPFTKPEVFWKVCFQWQNFAFLAALLTPCFFCVWLRADMLIALIPLLAGICLRPSPDVKSIMLQYGTETATVLLALSIIGFDRIRRGEKSRWIPLLLAGLPCSASAPRRLLLTALALVTLLTSFMAHYCFAQTNIGKNSFLGIELLPDQSEPIRAVREILTSGSRVLASERVRPHLIEGHTTAPPTGEKRPGDFIVMQMYDRLMDDPKSLEKLRRDMAADPHFIPVKSIPAAGGGCFVVFRVKDGSDPSEGAPPPRVISAETLRMTGHAVTSTPFFEVRRTFRNGRHLFLVRIVRVPDFDADFYFSLRGPWGMTETLQPFAMGLFPAFSCAEGSTFTVEVEAPPESEVLCKIEKRPFSGISRP